jgi:hypothetical protein
VGLSAVVGGECAGWAAGFVIVCSRHPSSDGERIGALDEPCLRMGVEPSGDCEHALEARLGV